MATSPEAQPTPAPRRIKKRFLIPGIILGVLALFLLGMYIRGSWADTTPRDPATSADGIICQLLQTPEGHRPVRCAVVLDHPIDSVWKVVTDYERYHEIFPTLSSKPVTAVRDGDTRARVSGMASSLLGDWPFEINVKHEEFAQKRVAAWEGSSDQVKLNRGSWTLLPKDGGRTLLVYSLEVQLAGYPTWVVNNVLLSRQPGVVQAVIDRLKGQPAP
jgi:uncharacterized membrane protein